MSEAFANANNLKAEVLGGIAEGAEVIVHPSNDIANSMRVKTQ